jgi:3-oxoadipate enol-lactonase
VSAVALHHRLEGPEDGLPLLLGGSLGTTLDMWQPQVRALSSRLRMIPFDHRGHGGSPVPPGPYSIEELGRDVLALLDRLELGRASYCGLSIGGMVGIWLAASAPERIERLVLICTAAYLPPASNWAERAAAVRAADTPEVVADTVVERWFTPAFAAACPEAVARHRAMIAATPAEGYAACCEAIAAMDLRSALARIAAPTLVVAGAQDPSTPPEYGREIAAGIAGARFELLDPCAHLANVERADEVNRLLEQHLLGAGGPG